MGPMSDESMPTLIEKPLAEILTFWAPGSAAWPWSDEYSVLVDDPVTERIRQRVRSEGIGFADATAPVLLGSDGRVWDGHHRIVIAIQEGMHSLMCEIVGAADRAWPSSPTLTRELSTAEGKARAELANALWMRTGQGGVSDVVIDALSEIVLELGWRPPARVIETVEELEALADGAYVKDANCWTWIICQSLDPDNEQDPTAHPWAYGLGVSGPTSLVALPATVLWEPEEAE